MKSKLFCGLAAILLAAPGCSNNPAKTDSVTVGLKMGASTGATVIYRPAASAATAIDSIKLSDLYLVIQAVKFETASTDNLVADDTVTAVEEASLATNPEVRFQGPFIVRVAPGQPLTFGVDDVPFGTYNKIRFVVHNLTSNDNLPVNQAFLLGSSVWASGQVFPTQSGRGIPEPKDFTFASSQNRELVVTGNFEVKPTDTGIPYLLVMNVNTLFTSGSQALDPSDSTNFAAIQNNFSSILQGGVDRDRDNTID